jgi:hypothetical protein
LVFAASVCEKVDGLDGHNGSGHQDGVQEIYAHPVPDRLHLINHRLGARRYGEPVSERDGLARGDDRRFVLAGVCRLHELWDRTLFHETEATLAYQLSYNLVSFIIAGVILAVWR